MKKPKKKVSKVKLAEPLGSRNPITLLPDPTFSAGGTRRKEVVLPSYIPYKYRR